MLSTMQDVPLRISRILEYCTGLHGATEVVTAVPGVGCPGPATTTVSWTARG